MQDNLDFFICHASEDKLEVAEPLAAELRRLGAEVWYDKWSLKIGDSLTKRIDQGLGNSRYGVVILSPNFFQKNWTILELNGLVQKEINGKKVILPIWHNIEYEDVKKYSLILADRIAGNTKDGIPSLAATLMDVLGEDKSDTPKLEGVINQKSPAKVEIGFKKMHITTHEHQYSLTIQMKLLMPPDQGRIRLILLWPRDIPIAEKVGVKNNSFKILNNIGYEELLLDYEDRIFPGQTAEILGPLTSKSIQYKFDNYVWSNLNKHPRDLICTVFFEDHMQVEIITPFTELNCY